MRKRHWLQKRNSPTPPAFGGVQERWTSHGRSSTSAFVCSGTAISMVPKKDLRLRYMSLTVQARPACVLWPSSTSTWPRFVGMTPLQ